MKTITSNECRVASDERRVANTDHGPRTTHPAVQPLRHPSPVTRHPSRSAFTLVEMLIVVSIMAILATLMFPALRAVKQNQIRPRARGELVQLETAIHAYQSKFGHYPPDSGAPYLVNQLCYELLGTSASVDSQGKRTYQTLDGGARTIHQDDFPGIFGPGVSGFINCNQPGAGDEAPTAMTFLKGLKPAQWLTVTNGSGRHFSMLGLGIGGPSVLSNDDPTPKSINPWRYNSSSPRYNPKSFDLWIDVMVGSKTNRICNWSERPLVVGAPY